MKPSSAIIHIADDSTLPATVEGKLPLFVLNTPNYKGLGLGCPLTVKATVVPNIAQELLSLSELFADQGFKICLDPDGISEMTLSDDEGSVTRVPIRYDHRKRGFYVDAITCEDKSHRSLLAARVRDLQVEASAAQQHALRASQFDLSNIKTVVTLLQENENVLCVQSCNAATKDPLILRRNLHGNNGGLNFPEAHELFGHKGNHPGCWICKHVLGTARYEKTVPPDLRVQSDQPGRAFTLDLCQWSHRANTGEVYTAVLRDVCTGTPFVLHLCYKSDFYDQFDAWLTAKRNDPDFNWPKDYKFCSELYLDNDGIWDDTCAEWRSKILDKHFVKCHWSEPDKKNTNARAENNVRAMERRTKSLLFSKNLPPEQWPLCCDQGTWLDARFAYGPNRRSRDGEDILPLEALTNGAISRRAIHNELSFFVGVGTPCLVWKPSVKGSDIASKVRWGIAQGMRGKTVRFLCPYNGEKFLSRSYMAVRLKEGINYWQFLGLKSPTLSNVTLIPSLPDSPMFITLPELADVVYHQPMAVEGVTHSSTTNPQPFVHVLDPKGRIFKPDIDGRFQPSGSHVFPTDNSSEQNGFLNVLTGEGVIGHGWNGAEDHRKDYNYQITLLCNRPREFIGRTFEKCFDHHGTPQLYNGRIINYQSKSGFFKVQYDDGEKEDFDNRDVIHHIIDGNSANLNEAANPGVGIVTEETEPLLQHDQHFLLHPVPATFTFDGNQCTVTDVVKGVNKGTVVEYHNGTNADSMPLKKALALCKDAASQKQGKVKMPTTDSFTCAFECKNYQLIPPKNDKGEVPPTRDFWNNCVRRVTWDDSTNKIIEDLKINELRHFGASLKLPVNVKKIRTTFFFRPNLQPDAAAHICYTTKAGDKIKNVLSHLGLRPEYMNSYFKYLGVPVHTFLANATEKKVSSLKEYCLPGIPFSAPTGDKWCNIVNAYHHKVNSLNPEWKVGQLARESCDREMEMLRTRSKFDLSRDMAEEYMLNKARAFCAVQQCSTRHAKFQRLTVKEMAKFSAMVATASNKVPNPAADPANIFEALGSENTQEWMAALVEEEESLDSLGVFLHNQSKAQLRKLGITDKFIMPSRHVVTTKRHPDRTIDRLKVRRVIQGHKCAMKRGIHYDESFTPSPTQDTTRIMQAMAIGHGLLPFAFDITCARQQAPTTGPKLAIKYPKGFEHFDPNTGEELYAVLQTNLNGKPDGSRQWGTFRDKWILDTFNSNGYQCTQSTRDPCLFSVTDETGARTHMICFTDDMGCYTESMPSTGVLKIADLFRARFGIKVVDPKFMLGVVRQRYERDGVMYCHVHQAEYIAEQHFYELMFFRHRFFNDWSIIMN